MNGTRYTAMWLGIAGVALGVIAIVAAAAGDLRLVFGWGTAVAAVALVVLASGALIGLYRPMAAAGVMLAGILGILVGEWSAISQWSVDLWTSGTGGVVSYVDANGIGHTPDFWGVLFGSVSMLGYAGALVLGTIGAIVAAFAPEPELTELRPATHPSAL
jgi:hypothetical protein